MEVGVTLVSGQLALQHVGEVIRQEQDLAAILLQRLVELIVLGMLRITRNAIHINVQLTEDGQTLEIGLSALQHVGEVIRQEIDLAAIPPQRLVELTALEMRRITRNVIHINVQLTEDGHTLKIGLSALQHVGEEIRQEIDLAAILLQRLVELNVLGMLRITKNAIQKNVQLTGDGQTLELGLCALQHVGEEIK